MPKTRKTTGTTTTVTVPGTTLSQTYSNTPSTYQETAHVDSASWTGMSMSLAAKEWLDTVASQYAQIVIISGRSGSNNGQSTSDDGHYLEDVGMFGSKICSYSSKVCVVDARGKSHSDVVNQVNSKISSAPTTGKTLILKNWCWSDLS
jgi:hypothetical protein